ncbi:MAG: ATP-binding cassette domain-containing protein [Holophagales bacterium]|nr:ATP-binding cassette domain-containing protein [Holophagales bacterium]
MSSGTAEKSPAIEPALETATRALLRVENLGVTLGGRPILRGLSFQVGPAELCALVGPNGSGKTTVLRSLLGRLPHEGRIELRLRQGRAGLGYVPQLFPIDPSLPVRVADLFHLAHPGPPLFVRRRDPEPMAECLERVGAPGFGDRLLGQLSGGELRRVLLAQALSCDPELLLLDEPASHLDDAGSTRFDELLLELVKGGGPAILVVAHGRPRLEAEADRVIRMGAGTGGDAGEGAAEGGPDGDRTDGTVDCGAAGGRGPEP